jgi:hypothetical protein
VDISGVNTIGDEAFLNCTALTTVNIPNAHRIGRYAFFWYYDNKQHIKEDDLTIRLSSPGCSIARERGVSVEGIHEGIIVHDFTNSLSLANLTDGTHNVPERAIHEQRQFDGDQF